MNLCLSCNQQTTNPKFCSMSCAAKYHNKFCTRNRQTSMKEYHCIDCTKFIGKGSKYRRKRCQECHQKTIKFTLETTLEELFSILPKFQANARIRAAARAIFFNHNSVRTCKNCGYSKFIEVCHIKPIASFPRTSTLLEVNDISNLIGLCPNCHWELDHGLLKIAVSGIAPDC